MMVAVMRGGCAVLVRIISSDRLVLLDMMDGYVYDNKDATVVLYIYDTVLSLQGILRLIEYL
jgi:hypothetical protein